MGNSDGQFGSKPFNGGSNYKGIIFKKIVVSKEKFILLVDLLGFNQGIQGKMDLTRGQVTLILDQL